MNQPQPHQVIPDIRHVAIRPTHDCPPNEPCHPPGHNTMYSYTNRGPHGLEYEIHHLPLHPDMEPPR